MSAGFTPGPWRTQPERDGSGDHTIWASEPFTHLLAMTVEDDDEIPTSAKANAHLIAAAPDTYSGCERAAGTFRAYAALHRAKGTREGDDKAAANDAMAKELEAICAKARGEALTPIDGRGGL